MCGIAGIITANADTIAITKMVARLHHRGPDDCGVHVIRTGARHLSLGSTRLSILDLSPAGHMPMKDSESENWIVYNGEIYNFMELRRQLERMGEVFQSGTDTEVILKAYRHWGKQCVDRFRGMFALAIWDSTLQRLFLARDRAGKKPLYYFQGAGGTFLFASEIRALLASNLVEPRLASDGLGSYLFNGFVIAPLTLVKGVYSLLPAHWMVVDLNGQKVETSCYWNPSSRLRRVKASDAIEELRANLVEAVKLRLISDAPLGAFLSGGLDSSTIVALMASLNHDIQTFSVTFDESEFDESEFSLQVATYFGTKHNAIRLRHQDFKAWLPAAVQAMDQPTFDGVNTYCVARAAHEGGMTVALSGIGADELFGGYPFFQVVPKVLRIAQIAGHFPHRLCDIFDRQQLQHPHTVSGPLKAFEFLHNARKPYSRTLDLLAAYQTTSMLLPYWTRQYLLREADTSDETTLWFGLPIEFRQFVESESQDDGLFGSLSDYALRIFLGERCLRDADMMSMGVSLELRAPFTDQLVVESLQNIPGNVRCEGAPNKPFEWELVKQYLGKEYPHRKKQGFVFPFDEWLRHSSFGEVMQATFNDTELINSLGFNAQHLKCFTDNFFQVRTNLPWGGVWMLYILLSWCDQNSVCL